VVLEEALIVFAGLRNHTVRNDKAKKGSGRILEQLEWNDAQVIRRIVEHSGLL